MTAENVGRLISEFETSLARGSFVKLTLGKPAGPDKTLLKIQVRPVETKRGRRLMFLHKHEKRDVTKNLTPEEAVASLRESIGSQFLSVHLFTTEADHQLELNRKGNSRLTSSKPTASGKAPAAHDRAKRYIVDQASPYLAVLGITTHSGEIRDSQRDKWKQINVFVEILDRLFEHSKLKDSESLSIVDMGSGKGYLTFAAYEHFTRTRGLEVTMTGVEERRELVDKCNSLAEGCGFERLSFAQGRIDTYDAGSPDILIALHACDTATDDAIFKGITAAAELIVTAPCCHKEIRRQMKAPEVLAGILRHGSLMEREAESLTDGLRAMLLEKSGYDAKVFEFIGAEHTPKNNMIAATRSRNAKDIQKVDAEIANLKTFYGIESQRLDYLLSD
jgi:hypothetical protein